jgi:hypothetical protein
MNSMKPTVRKTKAESSSTVEMSKSHLNSLSQDGSPACGNHIHGSWELEFSEKHSFLPVSAVPYLLHGSSRVELQRCRLVEGEGRQVLDFGFRYLNVDSTYTLSYHYPDDIPDDFPEQSSDDLSEDQSDDHVNDHLVLYTAVEPGT